MTLKDLNIGESAVITAVGGEGALRQHFLDMGLIPGEEVTLVKFAPMGDPMELSIHGYELTLRLDDAARIGVTLAKAPAVKKAAAESEKPVEHPGLGEGGRYHTKKGENPLPDGTTLTFALAGNQNCGTPPSEESAATSSGLYTCQVTCTPLRVFSATRFMAATLSSTSSGRMYCSSVLFFQYWWPRRLRSGQYL